MLQQAPVLAFITPVCKFLNRKGNTFPEGIETVPPGRSGSQQPDSSPDWAGLLRGRAGTGRWTVCSPCPASHGDGSREPGTAAGGPLEGQQRPGGLCGRPPPPPLLTSSGRPAAAAGPGCSPRAPSCCAWKSREQVVVTQQPLQKAGSRRTPRKVPLVSRVRSWKLGFRGEQLTFKLQGKLLLQPPNEHAPPEDRVSPREEIKCWRKPPKPWPAARAGREGCPEAGGGGREAQPQD